MPPETSPSSQPSSRHTTWLLGLAVVLTAGILVFLLTRGEGVPPTNQANSNAAANANAAVNINAAPNANAPSNTPANDNASVNDNTPVNTNSGSVPSGWTTYDSSQSEWAHIQRLDPAFTFSYPRDWRVTEDLGGVTLTQGETGPDAPWVQFSRSSDVASADIVTFCKARASAYTGLSNLVYDVARTTTIAGTESAYLSYHLPESVTSNAGGRGDSFFVCVPNPIGTDVILGSPRGADMIRSYFDDILATYTLR